MLISGFVRVISVVFMLIALQTSSVWWMLVFLVLLQISAAFYFPALQAAIPLVVSEKDLLQLNGVHMNVSTLSRIIGTAAAGILLVAIPLNAVYLLSMAAYIVLFGLTFFLQFDENKKAFAVKEGQQKQGFKDVFPVIVKLPIVMMTLILTLIPLIFLGGFNLVVINISELQDSSAIKGWIYTAEGLAFMSGAFLIKRISYKFSPYKILFASSMLIGWSQLMLYFANQPVLTIIAFLLFGFSVGCFFPTAATIFQTRVPKDYHGRFFSFRNMMDRVFFQVVLLMTGFLLDAVGLQNMSVMFGALSIVMTAVFFIRSRKVRASMDTEQSVS